MTTPPPAVAAIVPIAAGSPDPLQPLSGQTVVARVLGGLHAAGADPAATVVVCAGAGLRRAVAEEAPPATVVAVGADATRAQCVAAGLEYLDDSAAGALVLVADHRRPLVPDTVGARVVEQLRGGAVAVMPATPLTDSVKAVTAEGAVVGTVDRAALQTVQYPRGFTAESLRRLLADNVDPECDEFSAAFAAGLPVTLVDGHPDALPLDLPSDRAFARALIACRESS